MIRIAITAAAFEKLLDVARTNRILLGM